MKKASFMVSTLTRANPSSKPESKTAFQEIAKLLKGALGLKVNIVGHTDNVGGIDSNMKLSQARADSVVKELSSKYGIDLKKTEGLWCGTIGPRRIE